MKVYKAFRSFNQSFCKEIIPLMEVVNLLSNDIDKSKTVDLYFHVTYLRKMCHRQKINLWPYNAIAFVGLEEAKEDKLTEWLSKIDPEILSMLQDLKELVDISQITREAKIKYLTTQVHATKNSEWWKPFRSSAPFDEEAVIQLEKEWKELQYKEDAAHEKFAVWVQKLEDTTYFNVVSNIDPTAIMPKEKAE